MAMQQSEFEIRLSDHLACKLTLFASALAMQQSEFEIRLSGHMAHKLTLFASAYGHGTV